MGSDAVWDKSEKALLKAVKETKLDYSINKGEGAFYGPKIEFVLRDAIGRDWQCGTLQVDLNLPERLGASYVEKDGSKKVPVMLHRALFGSLERFINLSSDPNKARCNITGTFLEPSFSTYDAPNLSGKLRSTCNVPHCQSLPIASLRTNSIFGP